MSDIEMIPQINEIKPKKSLQVKIRSCFPENQSLIEQVKKLGEEDFELQNEVMDNNFLGIAREACDVATAAIGLAEIAIENGDYGNPTEKILQNMIKSKYRKKQKEFAEGKK